MHLGCILKQAKATQWVSEISAFSERSVNQAKIGARVAPTARDGLRAGQPLHEGLIDLIPKLVRGPFKLVV